jgi:predicted SAM-dependent methyltransferase
MMKLHIGGKQIKEGWQILNIQSDVGVDFIGDISNLTQFSTDSIDAIYASHVFEHVRQRDILLTLRGIFRVLKKQGKFYISVPDMDVLCGILLNPHTLPEQKHHVMRIIFGGQIDDFDFHYFGWNELLLGDCLRQAGFSTWEKVSSFGLFDDTSDYAAYGFPVSLNMVVTK